MLIRDDAGQVLEAFGKAVKSSSLELTEAMSVREGLRLAVVKSFEKI